MTSISPTSPFHTFWKPAALPIFTGLLALLGAGDGLLNLTQPETGAGNFGLIPPSRASVSPAQFDAFHHALIKVKGARNLHMSASILGLLLYAQFSEACRASPAAREAVHRCVGIVLTLGTGVGLSGAFVIWEYVKSVKTESSRKEIEVGRAKAKAHFITSIKMNAQASSVDFTLHYVVPDDVDDLVRVHTAAFKTDQFSNLMLLGRAVDAHEKLMRKTIEGWVTAPEASLMKAIDSSGRVLGWACWIVKDATGGDRVAVAKVESKGGSSVNKAEGVETSAVEKKEEPAKEDRARALGGLMYKERVAMEERYMKGKRYAVLQGLATDPAYQRRGIATKLIQAGLEEVDSKGLACWIHASPSSYGLYAKTGFEEIGRNEYDLDEWAPGGRQGDNRWGRYIFRHMLRKENSS
ncbi:hypothetical protein K4K58_011346 [Colletotrichum sp. SAR11_239]|nr:hypothetical protein K4K58_011346 [Colletotrichum sp. SAR11_239]